ncbi:MAG TPA: branched-chain amino acid ABC transporter permease [Aliidongia sp.]|uniref:branched-chain amino acid ABC transporter permease n=1 Tax=Aliidongia sp. TaxID=1914230 RepID=UPI002DDCD84B|nr:branched-chain amino acid ABC transporter permease [Aliidongia sp.]HEV2677379.1 branched-chain amino acid ABC transporter permease [Aliidongia sp.]
MTIAADTIAPRAKPRRGIPLLPLLLGAVALIVGFALPWIAPSKVAMSLMAQSLFDALLATSVGFLIRQNGRISFGQAAFFGLGGYVFAILIARSLVTPELAFVLALAVPTLVAFLFGLVVARVTGVAHAMLTLAIGQALYEVAFRWRELAKGDDGMSFNLPARLFGLPTRGLQDPAVMVVLAWSILVVALVGLTLFSASRTGQIAAAIRDNEERARFIGLSTTVPRALVYAIAAFIAAIAGILQASYNGYIAPQMLHWSLSGSALVMAIVGGAKFIVGPAIGAIVLFYIKDLAGQFAEYWPAIVGTVLVFVTLTMPEGIVGLASSLIGLRRR